MGTGRGLQIGDSSKVLRRLWLGADGGAGAEPSNYAQLAVESIMESVCMTKRSRTATSKMARSFELDQSRFCDDPEVSFKLVAHLLGSFWFYCQLDPHTKLQGAEAVTGGTYVVDNTGSACNILLERENKVMMEGVEMMKKNDSKDRMRQHIELATLLLLELACSKVWIRSFPFFI